MIVIVAEVDAGAALQAVKPLVLCRHSSVCFAVDRLGLLARLLGLFVESPGVGGLAKPADDPIHDLHG
jgi:hypothetical protein